ncbi:MAG: carboxypeptidase regulatory-like domain-containing protein, partial [Candidatus Cloacimonetes bacterium]|nr:carboxypeptidase regulatory-like domain-containing protein [Candidatus Cloacimonadota bacterium]
EIISNIIVYPQQELQSESQPNRSGFVKDEVFYNNGSIFPEQIVQLGTPAILRGLRVVNLTINPFQYDPVKQELRIISNIEVAVHTTGFGGENEVTRSNFKLSRVFEPLYKATVLNYDEITSREDNYQDPSYLFIHTNDTSVEDALSYLTDWKHQKGFQVATYGVNSGTSTTSIKNYIQNAYDTWDNPPEFVCLVGDAEGNYNIPTFFISYYSAGGDHPYAQLEGGDVLEDVFLGRISFESITELQTYIVKVLNYEKEPYMAETDWYNSSLMVGDPTSSSGVATIFANQTIVEMMDQTAPNITPIEVYSGSFSSQMSTHLNAGVSYFNYRGWLGMSGFGNSDIYALTNYKKLPFAVILTCGTGTFYSGTSRSEAFIRAGTPTNPTGAIASIGTATTGTHTNFNNCVDVGIFYGIFAEGIYHPGGALNRGKVALFEHYPQNPSGHVDNFSHMNTLMGDPGVELWTGIPQQLVVNYESQLGIGANTIAVNVQDANGFNLENAWVTALMGDDDIFATGYTGADGNVVLEINALEAGTVDLTVTKHDFIPHLGSFDIGQLDRFVNIFDYQIDDDNNGTSNGNNDGVINPGETVELRVSLKNFGTTTTNNVTATMSSDDDFITISDNEETFGNISPGTAVFCSDDFDLTISASTVDGMQASIAFQIEDSSGNTWYDYLNLDIVGAYLTVTDHAFPNNTNGLLEPGETSDFTITLQNLGAISADQVYGTLMLDDNWFTMDDDEGYFGNIGAGSSAANNSNMFEITANSAIIPGNQFVGEVLLYNTAGYENTVSFTITVGQASITDPVGPDGYGYYCYDDGDVNYFNVPIYDWVEINNIGTNLNLNDPGDDGDITQITNLPINFRFYGEEYTSMTVCSNGWISPGECSQASYMNSPIPGPQGPSPMIAPFWDDLKTGNGDVYWHYDSTLNAVIIEWDHMQNDYNNDEETFQVIIYDANMYPTAYGDSEIKVQYKVINNTNPGSYPSQHGQYSSIGLEDHTGLVGLEYSFNNSYPTQAKQLQNEMAILFTGPPIQFDEPYLVLADVVMDDENGNGQADYGEEIDLDITANNLGDQPATGITSTLDCTDPYITITQNSSNYNTIAGGGSGTNTTPFTIEVSENCPDGHVASFVLSIVSNEDSWELNFTIELNAPLIEYGSHIVNDSSLGNNNSIFDPGETVDIMLGIVNNGGSNAYGVEGTMSSSDPYITVNTTAAANFGNVPSGNSSTQSFSVTANSSTPYEHPAQFHMDITGDYGVTLSFDFVIVIGVDIELFFDDFESGLNQWNVVNNGGSGVWGIENPPYPNSYTLPAPSSGGVAAADADETYPIDCELIIASPINCAYYNEITLEFDNDFNAIDSDDWAYADISTNGGSTWNNIFSWNSDVRETHENFDISNFAAGEQNVLLRFYTIQPGWDWWWAIDNVKILAGGSPVALGTISGIVSDSDSGQPIQDVNVAGLTTTAADGSYEINLVAGTYDIIFTHDNYYEYIAEDIVVLEDQTTNLDVSMNAIPVLNPPSNVISEIQDFNDILISWNAPATENDRSISPNQSRNRVNLKRSSNSRKNNNQENTRDLSGYLVYRDAMEIAAINDPGTLSFLDGSLNAGIYEYFVIAVYDEGNSEPSNTTATEVILPAPQNLIGTLNYPNIELSWNAPQRGLDSYQIYRDEQMIADNITTTDYTDENVPVGTYFYQIKAVFSGGWTSDFSNEIEITMTSAPAGLVPAVTSLEGNYPNPFNPTTTINFGLHEEGFVSLIVYNIKGEKVRTLVQEKLSADYYSVIWDGSDDNGKQVSSGIYFYNLNTVNYTKTNKMILLK